MYINPNLRTRWLIGNIEGNVSLTFFQTLSSEKLILRVYCLYNHSNSFIHIHTYIIYQI